MIVAGPSVKPEHPNELGSKARVVRWIIPHSFFNIYHCGRRPPTGMVSLSSLFGGKKKQKAAGPTVATSATSNRPSSTIGTPGGTGTPATEAVQSTSSGSGKFLSVRQKSSASLGGAVSRRLSNATQLSSPPPLPTPAKNGANASRQSTTWELPKFEFDAQGKEGKLGLDNVGLPPQVSTAEWETVSGLELQVDEVKSAWSLLGPSVKGVGESIPKPSD